MIETHWVWFDQAMKKEEQYGAANLRQYDRHSPVIHINFLSCSGLSFQFGINPTVSQLLNASARSYEAWEIYKVAWMKDRYNELVQTHVWAFHGSSRVQSKLQLAIGFTSSARGFAWVSACCTFDFVVMLQFTITHIIITGK